MSEWKFCVDGAAFEVEQFAYPDGVSPADVLADTLTFNDHDPDADTWTQA